MSVDQIVSEAARRACAEPIYAEPGRPEAQLVRALHERLSEDDRVGVPRMECRFVLSGWTRSPGGVDLSVGLADRASSLIIEAKVGKPEEAIWDIIKLADILALDPTVIAAYLIYDAAARTWTKTDEATTLFTERDRVISVWELIEGARADWAWLLKGGRGIRPVACVGAVRLARVASCPLQAHEGHELRVWRVWPDTSAKRQRFDKDGWPSND
jgi:hypothetical protein